MQLQNLKIRTLYLSLLICVSMCISAQEHFFLMPLYYNLMFLLDFEYGFENETLETEDV